MPGGAAGVLPMTEAPYAEVRHQLSVSLAAQNSAQFKPGDPSMWKLIVGFIAFAALALYILTKSGGNIDLSGEKHDVTAGHEPAASAAAVEATSGPASSASQ